jgi:membrane protein DedA with SNARE-associated domain
MTFIEGIVINLIAHFYIVSFISGLIGEEAVLFLTFLASHSMMHVKIMFVLAPLGILLIDIIYFSIGRTKLFRKLREKLIFHRYLRIPKFVVEFEHKRTFLTLVLTKFILSTRVATIIYLGAKGELRYWKYIIYDIIAIEIWAAVMIPLAWLAGRGFTTGLHIVKDFSKFAGIAIIFCLIIYLLNRLIEDYLMKGKSLKEVR